ncbi:zinc-ribbon domain-containing protein [Nocardia suismassiliense]|uniref:zinc-ribbon domain-containing protein n=1 Tax=Nocardia suismassiliense TaxID=2077092 RepID=UPI00131EFC41|nr:zinc-ribbon domain-containing protein [Nocardia suismassiliense]
MDLTPAPAPAPTTPTSTPPPGDSVDSAGRIATDHASAIEWLCEQEHLLCETFLAEARTQLPVEDYAPWHQQQKIRLARARAEWIAQLSGGAWIRPYQTQMVAYLRPDLVGEYDNSHPDNPADLMEYADVGDRHSVWWRCVRTDGHRWRTSIHNRHVAGTGCPRCGKRGVSRREQEIFLALQQRLPALLAAPSIDRIPGAPGKRRQRPWRVDMLLPGKVPIVMEYDGAYWHAERELYDRLKTADLTESGHLVIRIREHPLPTITVDDVVCSSTDDADTVANTVISALNRQLTSPLAVKAIEPSDRQQQPCPPPAPEISQQLTLFAAPGSASSRKVSSAASGQLAHHRSQAHLDRDVGQTLVTCSVLDRVAALRSLSSNMLSTADMLETAVERIESALAETPQHASSRAVRAGARAEAAQPGNSNA